MRHVLLVVACAALLVGLHFSSTAGAQPVPAAQRERWEYATLSYTNDPSFSWESGRGLINGDGEKIWAAIGGAGEAPKNLRIISLLNHAGAQGWEVICVEPRQFHFKRRLP